jgi:RecB family exonuclease
MSQFERKLSHTSLSAFRRCKMRYKWGYIDNYSTPSSIGQTTGGSGHAALGAWYKALGEGKPNGEAIDLAMKAASTKLGEYEKEIGEGLDDVWTNLTVMLDRYFKWASENDDFTAYAIEHRFELEVDDFILLGYIDGLVERDDGTHWLLEHKFNKQVQTKHLEIDPQVSIYILAARALGFKIRGVIYNVIRTTLKGKAETEPVVRLPVFRNNEGLEQIVRETVIQMREMRQFHEANGEDAYRNPTRDCSWDCGFYNACLAMNDDGDPLPALQILPVKEYPQGE